MLALLASYSDFFRFIFSHKMEFLCQTCGARFTTSKSLQRHVRAQHLNEKHLCIYCHKPFMYISAKTRHERNNCATNKNRD